MKNAPIIILSALLLLSLGFIVWQNFLQKDTQIDTENRQEESVKNGDLKEEEKKYDEKTLPSQGDVRELIVGSWQSLDDEQSVVVFQSNGEIQDIYAGGAVNEFGTYQIFDSANSLPPTEMERALSVNDTGPYLRQTFGDQDYYYVILELDSEDLSLSYLARGNTLKYRRVDR